MSGEPAGLEWVELRKKMLAQVPQSKMQQKIYQNLFVPAGCFATIGALTIGLWSFRKGNAKLSQQMMRWRIAAQTFTIMAVVAGVCLSQDEEKQKMLA